MFKNKRSLVQFGQDDLFANYCEAISNHFCPFLRPAMEHKVLFVNRYSLFGRTLGEFEENVFYIGIIEIEKFRKRRMELKGATKLLLCENVIFDLGKQNYTIDGQKLFNWSHYLLKVLYTQVGIMIGKFWIEERDTSIQGQPIPEPPYHFLSIRSAVKPKDPEFFTKAKFLLPTLLESEDSGQNVHEHLLPIGCDITSIKSMRKHNYYHVIKSWVKSEGLF